MGKEEEKGEEKGEEGETGEVLREGEKDEGEYKKEGKGEEKIKDNILIIIIFRGRLTLIDRRSICSGRIHYKITLVLYSQVRQMLSSIKLNRTMYYIRGCSIHDLPHISTEHLGNLGT